MVDPLTPTKVVTDLVLEQMVKVTNLKIPSLARYLKSDIAWRESEALTAIRTYQAERAAKKVARKGK